MNVACPDCKSVFRVDPARVTSVNLRARCAVCGGLIAVGASIRWGDDFPSALGGVSKVAAPSPAPTPEAPPPPTERALAASIQVASVETALPVSPIAVSDAVVAPLPLVAPSWNDASLGAHSDDAAAPTIDVPVPPRVPPFSPARRSVPVTPAFGAPAFPASSLRPPTPAFTPAFTPPAGAGPVLASPPTPSAPAREPAPTATEPAPPVGAAAIPPNASGASAGPVTDAPLAGKPADGAPSPAPSVASSNPPAPPAPSSAAAAPSAPGAPAAARRPINPFLSNDPNQKARRLARALVSDMVAYNPGKREDGHRNGTLKQLFRDEIKKSYEEYVEQVGRDFAESTTHFRTH